MYIYSLHQGTFKDMKYSCCEVPGHLLIFCTSNHVCTVLVHVCTCTLYVLEKLSIRNSAGHKNSSSKKKQGINPCRRDGDDGFESRCMGGARTPPPDCSVSCHANPCISAVTDTDGDQGPSRRGSVGMQVSGCTHIHV